MTDAYSVQQILGNRIAQTPPPLDYSQRIPTTKWVGKWWVSVADYGAVGDGVTDDTKAIQNAINGLPATGGQVMFPFGAAGKYLFSSPLICGNGTASLQSTQQGIYLVGQTNCQGLGTIFVPTLLWNGPSGVPMIFFSGPIAGWGVENLTINGNNIASFGIKLQAACNGEMTNVTFNNILTQDLVLTAVTTGGTGHPDTQFNTFRNNTFYIAAGGAGIFIDGDETDTLSNSSFNTFISTLLLFPTSNTSMQGIYLKGCDTNIFLNTSIFGGGTGTTGVVFDYTATGVSSVWPANNIFFSLDNDVSSFGGALYSNVGTPGSGSRPNRIYGVSETNSGEVYPKLANTAYTPEIVNPGVALTGQTGSITATNIAPINLYLSGVYRINYYLTASVIGTGGTVTVTISWNDDFHSQSVTSSAVALSGSGGVAQDSIVIRALTGFNPQYSTTVSSPTGSPQYALYIEMEKLD